MIEGGCAVLETETAWYKLLRSGTCNPSRYVEMFSVCRSMECLEGGIIVSEPVWNEQRTVLQSKQFNQLMNRAQSTDWCHNSATVGKNREAAIEVNMKAGLKQKKVTCSSPAFRELQLQLKYALTDTYVS